MHRHLGLSLLATLLALAPAVYPRQGEGVTGNRSRGKNGPAERRPPARVDSDRAERQGAARSTDDEAGGRKVYEDDDVLMRERRDSRLGEVEALEMQCFNEVNRIRVARGLVPLAFNESLLRVARDYSRRMAEENFFSHNDPDGHTVRERVTEANIRWRVLGENLSYSNGYVNPVAVSMSGWMNSPPHRRNLLDQAWRQTAIGAWIGDNGTVYFTEIFLTQ